MIFHNGVGFGILVSVLFLVYFCCCVVVVYFNYVIGVGMFIKYDSKILFMLMVFFLGGVLGEVTLCRVVSFLYEYLE